MGAFKNKRRHQVQLQMSYVSKSVSLWCRSMMT